MSPADAGKAESSKKSKEQEETDVKKMMKEKSSTLIGQSLVKLTKLCMPKCVNTRESHVYKEETECL